MRNLKYIVVFMFILLASGCTKEFEDLNTDPYGISNESLKQDFNLVGALFNPMLSNIYTYDPVWVYQLQQNLLGDVYSGYMMPPTPFRGNSNNMTYDLVNSWNGFPWSVAYANIMKNALTVKVRAQENLPNFYAWSLIIKVEAMHRVSDMFGPIVYLHFGENATSAEYDSQEVAYNQFFADLDEAITTLTPYATAGDQAFAKFDMVYAGDVTKWVKFANSLRLRLAIRISNVNPAKAKIEAEKSLSHSIGVITTNDQGFFVDAGLLHPLSTINTAWNDIRMGAPMESILKGYNDARIEKYFLPSIQNGDYLGIRNGIAIATKSDYEGYSKLGPVIETTKVQLMTAAEVYFLRAEGALRGWSMGGTAQALYEQGITTSFAQHGISGAAAYIADNTSKAANYTDPMNATNNVTGSNLSQVTIAWEGGATSAVQLEKIITQKWIAMYPDGQEAWSEFRRTGFPKLFTVVVNNSGGKISTANFVRRVNLPASEYETNNAETLKAVQTLGGADNGGTRLWWDTGSNNFGTK